MALKDLKKVDYVIIGFICLLLLITGLVFVGKNKFSKSPVEAEKQVAFQVFFRGITITNPDSPFQVGENSFITIRNVPYTKLKIVDVKFDRRKIAIPANNKDKFILVDDVSSPFQYDFLVTLVDKAKITEDGAVVGGNKLKIGIPIVLEGKDYKLNGTISNVEILKESAKNVKNEAVK
jgi:hypothetical protein